MTTQATVWGLVLVTLCGGAAGLPSRLAASAAMTPPRPAAQGIWQQSTRLGTEAGERSVLQRGGRCQAWSPSAGTLRLKGGGIGRGGPIPFPRGSGDFGLGTWQMPSLGSGASLWVPVAGLTALIAFGQISDRLRSQTNQWTKTTSARVRTVFLYFAMSLAAWAASATVLWKTGLVPSHPLQIFGLFIATIFATFKISSLDYDRDRMSKVGWFAAFACLQGGNLSVILFQFYMRGLLHIVAQAAVITAADMTAVALIVASYPHKEWLWLRGAVSAGMGLLLGANLVNMMFGSRTLHAGISYVGAAMFTVGLLSNAQRILKLASHPPLPPGAAHVDSKGQRVCEFDPISHALTIYMDAVNLFFYILRIMLDQEMRNQSREGTGRDDDGRKRGRSAYTPTPQLRPTSDDGGPRLRRGSQF